MFEWYDNISLSVNVVGERNVYHRADLAYKNMIMYKVLFATLNIKLLISEVT